MISIRPFILASVSILSAACQAHFVWAQYRADERRQIVVTFAESPGDSVLDIMGKVGSQLAPTSPGVGKPSSPSPSEVDYPWKGTNGLFLGKLDYGVVDHGQGPYKLTYWYKAVARPALARKIVGKGLELVATQRANRWDVMVYRDGKLCPQAELLWGSGEHEKKASANAPVSIALPETPMAIPVRASFAIEQSGEFQGKDYKTTKEWSTLVLPPVARIPKGADESAYLTLQEATQSRDTIALRGFSCRFVATNGEIKAMGTVAIDASGTMKIMTPSLDGDAAQHVQSQVRSLFAHRLGGDFWKGEGRNPVTWSPQSKGLLLVNDALQSCYRFGKTGFSMVQRTFGPKILSLDIRSTVRSPWGGVLSKEYDATEKQVSDGKITSRLHYVDDFMPFLDEWMPKSRIVTGEVAGQPITMKVVFSDYRRSE